MTNVSRRQLGVATAAVTATTLLGTSLGGTAQAADRDSGTASSTLDPDTGIPGMLDPATGLAAQPGSGANWNDSIYFTSHLKAGGHSYGILAQALSMGGGEQLAVNFSVTDKGTGWYKNHHATFAKGEFTWSTTRLAIKTSNLTWTGDDKKMSVQVSVPWGSLDVQHEAHGPALLYGSTGAFPLFGITNYEYAFPAMRTTGTLTLQGAARKASGTTWLDRQWGPLSSGDSSRHWTWMNLLLPNGDALAIWDAKNSEGENCWATVLHPDGSYDVAAVRPLAEGAHRFWNSPTSEQSYPTRWNVEIPALKARIAVRLTGTDGQEFPGKKDGAIEATASFTGVYQGERVSGENYVEMTGRWPVRTVSP